MAQLNTDGPFRQVTPELLDEVTDKIVARFNPEKVLLFGSHVWGTPRADSDVDLLIVMESEARPAARSAQVSMECRPRGVAMDIIVRTPAELERRIEIEDPFVRKILEEGTVLYER